VAGALKTHVQGEQAVLLVEDPVMDSLQAFAQRESASVHIETPTLEDLFVELA
jgi:ABC-2 type transport system ATP-binding protein